MSSSRLPASGIRLPIGDDIQHSAARYIHPATVCASLHLHSPDRTLDRHEGGGLRRSGTRQVGIADVLLHHALGVEESTVERDGPAHHSSVFFRVPIKL